MGILGLVVLVIAIIVIYQKSVGDSAQEKALNQFQQHKANLSQVESSLKQRLTELIQQHETTLARKRCQLRYVDDYNVEKLDKWRAEVRYFVDGVLAKDAACSELLASLRFHLSQEGRQLDDPSWYELVFSGVEALIPHLDSLGASPEMSGSEYEAFCARKLINEGWSVTAVGGSGDQGVDLLAERNGHRIAIQCKCYSTPVGNAAVQEVIAGKAFEGATAGAVVSNAPFTVAAKQLASTAGIALLHHDQLSELEVFVSSPTAG